MRIDTTKRRVGRIIIDFATQTRGTKDKGAENNKNKNDDD